MKRLEFSEGASNKFWEIALEGNQFTVTFGRIGAQGTTTSKTWSDAAEARKEYEKLIAEKLKKGYREVSGPALATKREAGAAVKKQAAAVEKKKATPTTSSPALLSAGFVQKLSARMREVDDPAQRKRLAALPWQDVFTRTLVAAERYWEFLRVEAIGQLFFVWHEQSDAVLVETSAKSLAKSGKPSFDDEITTRLVAFRGFIDAEAAKVSEAQRTEVEKDIRNFVRLAFQEAMIRSTESASFAQLKKRKDHLSFHVCWAHDDDEWETFFDSTRTKARTEDDLSGIFNCLYPETLAAPGVDAYAPSAKPSALAERIEIWSRPLPAEHEDFCSAAERAKCTKAECSTSACARGVHLLVTVNAESMTEFEQISATFAERTTRLELTFEDGTQLPDDALEPFTRVEEVVLVNTKSSELPSAIRRLSTLRALDLGAFRVRSLPNWLAEFGALETIFISEALKTIPEVLCKMPALSRLRIEGAGTYDAKKGGQADQSHLDLSGLAKLRHLEFRRCSFSQVPDLSALKSCLTFGINGCAQLETLPDSLTEMASLESLSLELDKLERLPKGLARLKNLKTLKANFPRLKQLPDDISQLASLTHLELSMDSDSMKKLPESFPRLDRLVELKLEIHALKSLPNNFSALDNLQRLEIHSNALAELPPDFGKLRNLRSLSIENAALRALPKGFGELPALQELSLRATDLARLSDDFSKLAKLRRLEIIQASELDKAIQKLDAIDSLEELELSNCGLSAFPAFIAKLVKLRVLNLSENEIGALPKGVDRLTMLRELKLNSNAIEDLPAGLGTLPVLERLDLSRNAFTAVPQVVQQLLQRPHIRRIDYTNDHPPALRDWSGDIPEGAVEKLFTNYNDRNTIREGLYLKHHKLL